MKAWPTTKPHPSEAALIADELQRAFEGLAWHGPGLLELLEDVDAATAAARLIPDAHTIWELVLHVAVWDRVAQVRIRGQKSQPTGLLNFPRMPKPTEAAWRKAVKNAKQIHDALVKTVAALPDSRLADRVPGKRYNFSFMLHGIAQHELYHAGQIALLKKAYLRPSK